MKKIFYVLMVCFLALSVGMISCKKDNPPADNGVNVPYHPPSPGYSTSLAGLGEHPGTPSGTAFSVPAHIQIIGPMYGGDPGFKSGSADVPKTYAGFKQLMASMTKSGYVPYGYGTYVNVHATFFNTLYEETTFIIPAGVIMMDSIRDSIQIDTTQGGIIIVDDTITIPPRDTLRCMLSSFCLHLNYGAPDASHHYRFSVDTDNDQLNTMINILRNKKTLATHLYDIQTLIWKITNGAGLTEEDINMMNSWE